MTGSAALAGRVAVVTGGTRGIGLAVARLLAEDGASVVVSGRDADRLKSATRELEAVGTTVLGIVADAAKREDADRLVEAGIAAAHASHLRLVVICPFARAYMRRHPSDHS